jgi:hypothetical protein
LLSNPFYLQNVRRGNTYLQLLSEVDGEKVIQETIVGSYWIYINLCSQERNA